MKVCACFGISTTDLHARLPVAQIHTGAIGRTIVDDNPLDVGFIDPGQGGQQAIGLPAELKNGTMTERSGSLVLHRGHGRCKIEPVLSCEVDGGAHARCTNQNVAPNGFDALPARPQHWRADVTALKVAPKQPLLSA